MVALRVPEMCFWPAKIKKSLNFLRCIHVLDLVLNYGSDINERNWLHLLFCFFVLLGIVASVIGMSFFSAVFLVLNWSFLVMHFYGNVCNWIPKAIWPRMDWFLGFFVRKWLLKRETQLKKNSFQQRRQLYPTIQKSKIAAVTSFFHLYLNHIWAPGLRYVCISKKISRTF